MDVPFYCYDMFGDVKGDEPSILCRRMDGCSADFSIDKLSCFGWERQYYHTGMIACPALL